MRLWLVVVVVVFIALVFAEAVGAVDRWPYWDQLYYRQDPRTGVCFAFYLNRFYFTHVPCEKIPPSMLGRV